MSWGFSVTAPAADIEGKLLELCAAHFDEADRAATFIQARLDAAIADGLEPPKREIEIAAWNRGAAAAGRAQAETACRAAALLAQAEHIDPVTVSVTGDANPDHTADHEHGLPARISVSLVRA